MSKSIPPFSVEATHPRWCDLLVQGLTGVIDRRLRSRITPTTIDIKGKPRTQALNHQSVPETPGMVLEVHPQKKAVRVVDGLAEDTAAQDAMLRFLKASSISKEMPKPVPTREGTMDEDRMKTLCREIFFLIQDGHMTIKKGAKFTLEDCDELPGHYLLNPGTLLPNNQPRYEKDLPEYVRRINNIGV